MFLPARSAVVIALCNAALPALASEQATADGDMIDDVHTSVDNFVQDTVNAIDGFFVTDDFATFNDKQTRIRLRLNTDYVQDHGWELSPKVKLHLVLPGLNDRLRLVINDDQGPDVDQESPTDDGNNDIALRWIGRQNDNMGISFDLGLRIKGGDLDPFGRVNTGIQYPLAGKWVGQSTNRLYYYAETGWRNDFRQYFNRHLTDKLLIRSRTRLQYFEENVTNPFIEQKFSLFQTLKSDRALAYELMWRRVSEEDSPFNDDEVIGGLKNDYQHFIAQVRYRQQFLKEWFYFEFWPIVAWPQERDYQTTLGARFRLEVNFGGSGDRRLDE